MKQMGEEFIRNNRIGGILCCSDTDAVRIIGRLKKYNFTFPGEIALISYGNTEITEFFDPAISVIDCKYADMAAQTARLIDNRGHASPLEQYVIFPQLLIRET
jgi:DNA-binding LacI/PurR family transcriptional regulator